MASKVYFADLRADYHENLQQKLTRLMKTAGMGDIDFNEKYVAIKMHFGELGNLAFLRPNYAKAVADVVKEQGGVPFLTDCNTLYVGGRKNALDHMDSAMVNGFNYMTTGCQIIIGDGLRGTVGTVNLDYRSLFLHFENNSLFYRSGIVEKIKEDFLTTQALCSEVQPYDKKRYSRRWAVDGLLRIFAPLC